MPAPKKENLRVCTKQVEIFNGLYAKKYQANRASTLNVFETWCGDWLLKKPGPQTRYHPDDILAYCHFLILNESCPQILITTWNFLVTSYQVIYLDEEKMVTKLIQPMWGAEGLMVRRRAVMTAVARRPLAKAPIITRQAIFASSERLKPVLLLWLFSGLRISEFVTIGTCGVTAIPDGTAWIVLPNRRKIGGAGRPCFVFCNCRRTDSGRVDNSWCPIHLIKPQELPFPIDKKFLDMMLSVVDVQGHSFRRTFIVMLRAAVEKEFLRYEQMNFMIHMARNSRTAEGYAQNFQVIAAQVCYQEGVLVPVLPPFVDYLKNALFRYDELVASLGFVSPTKTRPANPRLANSHNMLLPVEAPDTDTGVVVRRPVSSTASSIARSPPTAASLDPTGSTAPVSPGFYSERSIWHHHAKRQCSVRPWGGVGDHDGLLGALTDQAGATLGDDDVDEI